MKPKKIGTKLILGILAPVIIAFVLYTVISARKGQVIISEQTQEWVSAELIAQKVTITNELNMASSVLSKLSTTVTNSYKTLLQYNFEVFLKDIIEDSKIIYGSGIWFEPNEYKPTEKYGGFYAYRNGKEVVVTYDRNTPEYDYFNREFYLVAKEAEEQVYLRPYYDEMSGKSLITCVLPMRNPIGNYIGCVSIEIDVSSLQNIIGAVRVGDAGDAMLLEGETGTYLGNSDPNKVSSGMSILDEENTALIAIGQEILAEESGFAHYQEGAESYTLYYDTIPGVDWKIVIRIPQSQLDKPVRELVEILAVIGVVAAIVSVIAILILVRSIAKGLKRVHKFANTLAQGDFSIEPMSIRRIDELGQMGKSLNVMYESNKIILTNIYGYAEDIHNSSENLNNSANKLLKEFKNIVMLMDKVNGEMMSASAATQEVNASVEEVSSSVNILAGEAEKSKLMSEEIKGRASKIEKSSREAYNDAIQLSRQYEDNLNKSIENAQVVESIGKMAEMISDIAQQINLLSLNASIEAARAGEQGRGFAVVATEIGKMAGSTTQVVREIQKTIEDVKLAFDLLMTDSKSLINFLKETVTPDYDKFVDVAKQYGEDAAEIEGNSTRISNMLTNIENIMGEVTNTVQNISESTHNTADSSNHIMNIVDQVSQLVGEVSEMSKKQESIAGSLNEVVGKFKLD